MKKTRDLVTVTVAATVLLLGGLASPGLAGTPHANGGAGNGNGNAKHEPAPGAHQHEPIDLVVRLTDSTTVTPHELERQHPIRYVKTLLASRRIHVFEATDPRSASNPGAMNKLARAVARSKAVAYAEPDAETMLVDDRYHSWPNGTPRDAGPAAREFRTQALTQRLQLSAAHRRSQGAGTVVAVLDTGASGHPELSGRLLPGYDFVDDDADPTEVPTGGDGNANGIVDEAYGHGTFVAGLVALVAPRAKILPMRVLDADGKGSVFLVTQAILEAVDGGAHVINISLGTGEKVKSRMLDEVISYAQSRGTHVVAAAGNGNTHEAHYPAQNAGVLAVTSTDMSADRVSDFANFGDWVDVAAPADRVLGPLPDGRYAWWAGTSMAAPQVSAQVALIIAAGERNPDDRVKAVVDTTRSVSGKKVAHGRVDIVRSLGMKGSDD